MSASHAPAAAASYSSYYRPAAAAAGSLAHHGHDAPPPLPRVCVLTLRVGPPALEARLSAQRRRWFPPARLRVPDAHITVFHALPADGDANVGSALARAARALPPRVPLRLGPAFRLGRQGVAVGVVDAAAAGAGAGAGVLARARRELVRGWLDGDAAPVALSPQDRRPGWRPHYTVLNKEGDAGRVDACLAAVAGEEEAEAARGAAQGWADGFVLWRYERDGRWTWAREFGFGEGAGEPRAGPEEAEDGRKR